MQQRWDHSLCKALHTYSKILHISHIFEVALAFLPELFIKRRGKAGDFFKLVGQVRHAAVV